MSIIKGFVTNLGKYNEGELIGEWVVFPCDEDEWSEVLERIGINEEYEEYFFTDWEYEFDCCYGFGEYELYEEVNELAENLEILDDLDFEKYVAIVESGNHYNLFRAYDDLDSYGFYGGVTLEEFAMQLVEDCYFTKDTPDIFTRYFDYEQFARDLSFEGYVEANGGVLWYC